MLADGGADLIIGGHPHVVQPARMLMAEDGREVRVFYSLGNFLSHQTSPENMLGGMASVTICMDETGAYVEDYELLPTINLITKNPNTGWYNYSPMLLSDYTPELAATHHIPAARWTPCRRFLIKLSPAPPDKENPYLKEAGTDFFHNTRSRTIYTAVPARMLRNVLCFHLCANAVAPTPSSWHTPPGYHASGTLLRQ